jgi:DNA-binding response OmpR family regulator
MAKGRVLVIDGDEWVARLLAAGLRDYGFDVSTSVSGVQGLEAARVITPDCIVTEMALPDADGPSVVRALREEAKIGNTPVVILSNADDAASRMAAFQAGGDVYLTKPFRVEEIAMQVQAMVAMRARFAGSEGAGDRPDEVHASSEPDPESIAPGGHAIEGNIAQMSIATVLTLLEMEHRTGVLSITTKGRKCTLEMVGGFACSGSIGGSKVSPLAVLRQILCWKEGRFRFRPGTDTALPSNRRSIGALLIEAVRLDDESAMERAGEEEEAPTSRRPTVSSPPPSRRAPVARRLSRPPPAAAGAKPVPVVKRLSRPPPAAGPAPTPKRASRNPPAPPGAAPVAVPRPPPLPVVRPGPRGSVSDLPEKKH